MGDALRVVPGPPGNVITNIDVLAKAYKRCIEGGNPSSANAIITSALLHTGIITDEFAIAVAQQYVRDNEPQEAATRPPGY